MKNNMSKLLLLGFFIFISSESVSAGVDCRLNSTLSSVERQICRYPELSQADAELSSIINVAMSKLHSKEMQTKLDDLVTYYKDFREQCTTNDCIAEWYRVMKLGISDIAKLGEEYFKCDFPETPQHVSYCLQEGINRINGNTEKYSKRLSGDDLLQNLCLNKDSQKACLFLSLANTSLAVINRDPNCEAVGKGLVFFKKTCNLDSDLCPVIDAFFKGDVDKVNSIEDLKLDLKNNENLATDTSISSSLPQISLDFSLILPKENDLVKGSCDIGFEIACSHVDKNASAQDNKESQAKVEIKSGNELKAIKVLGFEINKTKKSDFLKKTKIAKQKDIPFLYFNSSSLFSTLDDDMTVAKENKARHFFQDRLQMENLIGLSALFDENDYLKSLVLELKAETSEETEDVCSAFLEYIKQTFDPIIENGNIFKEVWEKLYKPLPTWAVHMDYQEFKAKDNVRIAYGKVYLGIQLQKGVILISSEEVIDNIRKAETIQKERELETQQKNIQKKKDNARSVFGN